MLRNWFQRLAVGAFELNQQNILDMVRGRRYARVCDLGCDDGNWSLRLASAASAGELVGVELVPERASVARSRGIDVAIADLNAPFPFEDESFDLVHANQVIEHIADLDTFLSETQRIVKPGGSVLISTENGSSWHNVAAAAMGWQIFSLTNISPRVAGVGNPFALHRLESPCASAWTHKTIFNYTGLLEMLRAYGLEPVSTRGAGYHPLPVGLGRWDPRHAHVLAVLATRRPN